MHQNISNSPLRQCHRCGVSKPATTEYFGVRNDYSDGLNPTCKECVNTAWRKNASERHDGRVLKRAQLEVQDGNRRCTRCGQWFPNSEEYYYSDSSKPDGLSPKCKACSNAEKTQWRANNPDKVVEASRRQRASLTPEQLEQKRAYAREYSRAYYWANRERIAKNYRLYYSQNREYHKQRTRRYNQIHGHSKSDPKSPAQVAKRHRRIARKLCLPYTLTSDQWRYCLEYFDGKCAVCGRPAGLWHSIAADHWIPLASPDCPGTVATNIVPLCHGVGGCNNSKSASLPKEWLQTRFGKKRAREILKRINDYFRSI